MALKPLKTLVIVGPTASGKTKLAIEKALEYSERKPEILSADARQVYRYFDLGTGKIKPEEMQGIPHHGIDIVEPTDKFTLYHWQKYAWTTLNSIQERGGSVIIVGGTGLYVSALLKKYAVQPEAELAPDKADFLAQASHEQLLQALDEEIFKLKSSEKIVIDRANRRRVERFLTKLWTANLLLPASENINFPELETDIVFLDPARENLYDSINARVKGFFDQGLVEEVQSLLQRFPESAAPFSGIGYAETLKHIKGEISLKQAIEHTQQASRNYAKRQLTWFRNWGLT